MMIFLVYDKLCKDKENKMWFLNILSEKRIKELSSHKKMLLRRKSKKAELIWKMKPCWLKTNLLLGIKPNLAIYNMV